MGEYVKIKSGASSATMANAEWRRFVDLIKSDESPGTGWYPVQKSQDKPTPGDGEELAYSYTIANGVASKEYFVIPAGKRYFRDGSIKVLSRNGKPCTIEIDENLNPVIIEDD